MESIPYLNDPLEVLPTGAVTTVLHRWNAPAAGDEEVFDAVREQLTAKARAMIARFPGVGGRVAPEELVNEFHCRLVERLAPEDVSDRHHFFALACNNFRWIILDLLKRRTGGGTSLPHEIADPAAGPATVVARSLDVEALFRYIETELSVTDRTILDLRALQGLTYRQIGEIVVMPLQTVEHRYKKILEHLRERFET